MWNFMGYHLVDEKRAPLFPQSRSGGNPGHREAGIAPNQFVAVDLAILGLDFFKDSRRLRERLRIDGVRM
jgi:hypothetical protein